MVKIHNIKKAMDFEFQSLHNNKTWIFTPLPSNRKPVSCKWIFKIEYNVDGFMAIHKAHLMAKAFTQVEGIDFDETFPLLHEWNQFELCLQLQPLKILRCIKWMLKLPL
jgi:hypothetical protein